jgi:hypothetical protein
MARQHSSPYIFRDGSAQSLNQLLDAYNETWLQEFIFTHSEALPIGEIEPAFGPIIPVCRELRTDSGPIDILFVNREGLLTLVECKLWNNPEARRAVVGQILDYAKDLSSWSYGELETAIRNSRKGTNESLYQTVANNSDTLDESEFIDNVERNLRRGRFLLLIVGSGIREGVEHMIEFLQRHAHLNFGMGLVEVAIFGLPDQVGGGHLVLPRVVAQTIEVERAVIRIEEGRIVAELPAEEGTKPGTRTKISEQAFYDKLAEVDPRTSQDLREFLDRAKKINLFVAPGQNSLMLKFISDEIELNFGIFRTNGEFWNKRIAHLTERFGYPEIGEAYLTRLASLIPTGYLYRAPNKWRWTVKKGDNEIVTIRDCLSVQDKWLELIQDTIDTLQKAQEEVG